MSQPYLSALYRYPVKSARGHSVDHAALDAFGLAGDRRWMLVDEEGRFLSQRSLARLALLEVEVLPSTVTSGAGIGGVRLGWQGEWLEVEQPDSGSERLTVEVWRDSFTAVLAEGPVHHWLQRCLGVPARLVYCPDDGTRTVEPGYAPPEQRVAFSDGYPLLLISQAALDNLNERLPAAVPMDRFRPNIVVAGVPAHSEDQWRRLQIGNSVIELVKPCSRCVIPSIDQATAERDGAINRELAAYRRRDGAIYFGMNAVVTAGTELRVGDGVQILR